MPAPIPPTDVRRCRPDEALALATLAADTFREAFGAANRPEDLQEFLTTAYGEPQQRGELCDPDIDTFVAAANDGLIGFAQLRGGTTPTCVASTRPLELSRLYVAAKWHGHGIAQRLIAAVAERAIERRGDALWLGVWERNPRARAFYRKAGFRDVGTKVFVVGADPQRDIVMLRELGDR
jgi:ribosomal protein S18 acetylase RimI-like enzyme